QAVALDRVELCVRLLLKACRRILGSDFMQVLEMSGEDPDRARTGSDVDAPGRKWYGRLHVKDPVFPKPGQLDLFDLKEAVQAIRELGRVAIDCQLQL